MSDLLARVRQLRLARWVTQSQRGDREAFRRLYRALHPPVSRYVSSRVRARADAEELVAEVFLRLVEVLPRIDAGRGTVLAYVLTMARHAIADRARAQPTVCLEPALQLPDLAPDAAAALAEREELDRVRAALASLPAEARELVALRFGDELRHAEIAAVMGLSEAAVRQRLSRTLRELKSRLAGEPVREELAQ